VKDREDYRDAPVSPPATAEPDAEDGAPESEAEVRQLQVPPELHATRLDKVLATLVGEFSRGHLQDLVNGGQVRVGAAVIRTASRKVRAGETIVVELLPTAQSLAFRPEAVPFDVVHEDEDLLVVNKRAGLVVHPAAGNWSGTLLNGLLHAYPDSAALPRAGIVHRLDKDTSGLMVVGRTLQAVTALTRAIAAREVHREYRALAHGLLASARTLDAPIGRDPVQRTRMAVVASGRPARTDVQPVACAEGVSALICTLHTGRTHQIRVHLAHAGHPLVADTLYGGRPALDMTRQALHAFKLELAHPRDQRLLAFECPPPPDFARAWARVTRDPG
jgi:23S rRNA pseudouridine1911/1915/1917 synthase